MLSGSHHDAIQRWLSPSDPSTNYNEALKLRHAGSGQWLLRDSRYTQWKEKSSSFLWLNGIPGCGKTVLSSTVLKELEEDPNTKTVLYFYFSFTDVHKQSREDAIRTLASQLYNLGAPGVQGTLDACFISHKNGQQQPSFDSLRIPFQNMMQQAGETWFVLDALDECPDKDQQRRHLLEWIQEIAESGDIHLLVTSRPEPDIKSAIEEWASPDNIIALQSNLVQGDISSYIKWEVKNGKRLERWCDQKNVQQEIQDTLTQKANGMYEVFVYLPSNG